MITAALCWWNELPEDLERCVTGIATAADQVYAFDGAYARYPGGTAKSPKIQVDAIESAARAAGIECRIFQPDRLWAGQVQKRSYLLSTTARDSDWILTVDADHVIDADKDDLRGFLATRRGDVYTVQYVTPSNPDRDLKTSSVGKWHEDQMNNSVAVPHIWRAMPGMRVENLHWHYSGLKDGKRVWLWGGDGSYPEVRIAALETRYFVEHRTMFRTSAQIKASRTFLHDRTWIVDQTGQEDDLPYLPPPKQNHDWVPW